MDWWWLDTAVLENGALAATPSVHAQSLKASLAMRGRPVARLVPVGGDPWAEMVSAGRVTRAEDETDIAAEAPAEYDVDASSVLAEMRSNER